MNISRVLKRISETRLKYALKSNVEQEDEISGSLSILRWRT
jgi:hypothetical protein